MKSALWKHIRVEQAQQPVYRFVTVRDSSLEEKVITLGLKTVSAQANREHLKALKEMNIDGIAQLESVLYSEMEQSREKEAVQALTGMAVAWVEPPTRSWMWLHRILGHVPKRRLDDHNEVMTGISKAWVSIEKQFKLAPSFMLVSPMTAAKLADMPRFTQPTRPMWGAPGQTEAVGMMAGLEVLLNDTVPNDVIVVGAGNAEQLIGGLVGAETESGIDTFQLDEINQRIMLSQHRTFAFVGLGSKGYMKLAVTHERDSLLDYIKLKLSKIWKLG